MKKFILKIYLVLAVLFFVRPTHAQTGESIHSFDLDTASYTLAKAGLALSSIGDQTFIGLRIQPEISMGRFGAGLDIPLLFNIENGKFRTEEFTNGVGALRMVRYFRYGIKDRTKIYVRVGELNRVSIGYGGLVNNYTNATSQERRKFGVHFDLKLSDMFGIEGVYSDINPSSLNFGAVRPFVRPLAKSKMPIIKTLEFGATVAFDFDQTKQKITANETVKYVYTKEGVGAYGVDAGLTIINSKLLKINAFAEFNYLDVKSDSLDNAFQNPDSEALQRENGIIGTPLENDAFQNGFGYSYGVTAHVQLIPKLFAADARLERYQYSDHYQPQFFDFSYEIDKDYKLASLGIAEKQAGTYLQVNTLFLNMLNARIGARFPDKMSNQNPGMIQGNLELINILDKTFFLRGSYFKGNLTTMKDAFTFDDRSLATLRVAYKFTKTIMAGLDYYWTFAAQEDGSFKPSNYMSPYVGFYLDI